MKQTKSISILAAAFLFSIIHSSSVFATSCGGVNTSIINCNEGGDGGIFHILLLVLDILSIGIGILAVIGISIAGVTYMTAKDDTAKATKSKRRLYEIVNGVACYVVLYGVLAWLLPGQSESLNGGSSPIANSTGAISASHKGKVYAGQTFTPDVKLSDGYSDTTYSLVSKDTNTAVTIGHSVKCQSAGKATIEAVASDGKRSSFEVTCQEEPETVSQTSSPSSSSSSSSSSSPDSTTTGTMLKTNYNMKKRKKAADGLLMRQETLDIINKHRTDFYFDNYHSFLQKKFDNKYRKYVKSLGGVFEKYAKTGQIKIKTAADFQEAAEYVWGLWTIWGVDYWNPSAQNWCYNCKYWRQDRSWKGGRSDGFYSHQSNRAYNASYIDASLSINSALSSSVAVRTGCNMGCYNFVETTNLKRFGGPGGCNRAPTWGAKIHNGLKLRVGDVIFFPKNEHVALVGEVYKDYIVIYENGYRFPSSGNYKSLMERHSDNHAYNSYKMYDYWVGWRPWDIDQSITLEGIN